MKIRPATAADHGAILALVPRISDVGSPSHRTVEETLAADLRAVGESLASDSREVAVLVAEEKGRVVGFVHLQTSDDYYSNRPIGHVADVAVDPALEGRGIARALMAAAEDWARARGYALMDLNVVPGNERARVLYERLGYRPEWTKFVKRLE